MSSFDSLLFNQGMPTSLTPSAPKLINPGSTDPFDFIHSDIDPVKNELISPQSNELQADDIFRGFQEWSLASLKQTPNHANIYSPQPVTYNPALLTPQLNTPVESLYSDFSNFEDTPYESPFDTPLAEFEDEALPSTPQYTSPLLDEGYNTGNSKAFYIDFGFGLSPSPEQLQGDFQGDFQGDYSEPIYPSNAVQTVPGSLFIPIEDLTNKTPMPTALVGHRPVETTGPAASRLPSTPGHPKRKRIDDDSEGPTRQFACGQPGCGRVFARLFNLHTHEKTHDPNRDKPFVCSAHDCSKAFARKHDLYRHETSVHDGLRDYKCDSCAKLFSRKDALRRHLAVKGCVM